MNRLRIAIGFLAGIVLTVLALEMIFRFLPVVSGLRMQNTDAEVRFNRYLSDIPYTYSHGWALMNARTGRTNHEGFNNSEDFQDNGRALVIGDSFIESLMLEYPRTVQGNLSARLGGKVYAASSSGNGLADSLAIARYYLPRIHPKNVVLFVEETDLSEILKQPQRGHSAFVVADGQVTMTSSPYAEAGSKTLVLHSALLRYVYYNLKFKEWFAALFAKKSKPPEELPSYKAQRQQALDYYFRELRRAGSPSQVNFIFLVDGDRRVIYDGRAEAPIWRSDDRQFFLDAARSAGFAVVDMQPVFRAHWAQLHERMDFLPGDGHWNAVAHRLAADGIIPHLK